MIDHEDIDRLKEIFVTRHECDNITDDLKKKHANESTRLAVIDHQLKTITWILTTVGGCVITILLKMFFGG